MNVALMVITDGRWDYLNQAIKSAEQMLRFNFCQKLLIDDSGEAYGPTFAGFDIVRNATRKGLVGAIQTGWDWLDDEADFVFHLEDDFVFPAPVDVAGMVGLLEAHIDLAQVALLRQPWSPPEHAAGSIYAMNPDDYWQDSGFIRHRRLFTFNPCVYPRHVTRRPAQDEIGVTQGLLEQGFQFAYLGQLDDAPRCLHIGVRRSKGYQL